MEDKRKSLEQLISEGAGCVEFAFNGYVRIYEEGEKRCECKDCLIFKQLNEKIETVDGL